MSRSAEQNEEQVELEEDVISGNGEADEVMNEVDEGYSESHVGIRGSSCFVEPSFPPQHHQHLHPLSLGLAGFALCRATSIFARSPRIL